MLIIFKLDNSVEHQTVLLVNVWRCDDDGCYSGRLRSRRSTPALERTATITIQLMMMDKVLRSVWCHIPAMQEQISSMPI